jgi:hypothetical protein
MKLRHLGAATALLIASTTLVGARPAAAIIHGSLDGSRHPYVGAVDGRPVGGPVEFGSGVLISPTVFLSVGHGTARFDAAGITRARVTFDPVVTDSSTWYEGTIHTSPAFDPAGQGQRGDFGDLGVIVFDEPVVGIEPARLASPSTIRRLAQEPAARVEIAGYGVSRYLGGADGSGKRTPDYGSTGTRRLARAELSSVSPGWLRLHSTGSAEICTGDSGSPALLAGTNLILGITAVEWSLSGAECESGPWEQRVDTPAARAFLAQYVALP